MARKRVPPMFIGWNVLIVDDEPDSLMVAQMLLEMAGATVRIASDGQAGLAQVKQAYPHFILSDLSMPTLDGWGLIYALQSDPYTASIPVIALTAHAMVGDRERVMRAGFTNYLTKPLDPATFIPHLVRLLADLPQFGPVLRPYLMETTGE